MIISYYSLFFLRFYVFTNLHKKRNPNSTHSQRNTPLLFFPAHGKIIAWAGKNKSMGRYIIICNNVIQQTAASHIQTFYRLLHTLVSFSTLAKQVTN